MARPRADSDGGLLEGLVIQCSQNVTKGIRRPSPGHCSGKRQLRHHAAKQPDDQCIAFLMGWAQHPYTGADRHHGAQEAEFETSERSLRMSGLTAA